jgi:hypothetical protein
MPPEVPGNQLRQEFFIKINAMKANFLPLKDQHSSFAAAATSPDIHGQCGGLKH